MNDPIHPASGDLLPCPFCGGPAELMSYGDRVGVRCEDVMCAGSHRLPADGESPVPAWNRRTPAAPPATAAGVGEALKAAALATDEPLGDGQLLYRTDWTGERHIVEAGTGFVRVKLPYDYAHTSNAQQRRDAERIASAFTTPASHDALIARVPADVARLVVAARKVAFEDPSQEQLRELDIASEAFASRVPWDDEPADLDAGAGR